MGHDERGGSLLAHLFPATRTPAWGVNPGQPPQLGGFVFQKRLALLDASDPQGLKKPCAPEHPPSSLGSHRRLQEPVLEHQRAQSQQQRCQLPRPSAELQSSEEEPSEGEGGDDWEEGALRLEQHLSALQGEGLHCSQLTSGTSCCLPGSDPPCQPEVPLARAVCHIGLHGPQAARLGESSPEARGG